MENNWIKKEKEGLQEHSISKWAIDEIEMACNKENPNWDGESFDYGCSCYKSAYKAYKSLLDDGHSGASFSITKGILEKLLNNCPLSPITEKDFGSDIYLINDSEDECCTRRSGLYKVKKGDKVYYTDVNRSYCVNAEDYSDTFHGFEKCVVDEYMPIKMPYMPSKDKYKVFVKSFETKYDDNKERGYAGILYIISPDGKRTEVNQYYEEDMDDNVMKLTTKENFEEKEKERIDTIESRMFGKFFNIIDETVNRDYFDGKKTEKKHILLSDKDEDELLKLCSWFKDYPQFCSFLVVEKILEDNTDYILNDENVDKSKTMDVFHRIREIVENNIKNN